VEDIHVGSTGRDSAPGFDWDGRIQMLPAVPVHVHDAYVAGEGVLHASLLGAITLANLRGGGEIAQGELMRFLAESRLVSHRPAPEPRCAVVSP
jgi:hypothetical protein